ncbi:hypothetical protein DS031_18565 [Bacillus taeanensis]|uniref:Uncharacterized protein n=1 Tax=Bacillus taeanensis TaxID=273032 RepID=A0A366XVW2_9BACI|nr:hypothetical protein DS031_18565 [Bacillus taeanensis]
MTDITVNKAFSRSNEIVKVDYQPSPLTRGYGVDDIGFVYSPVWYSNTANAEVASKWTILSFLKESV